MENWEFFLQKVGTENWLSVNSPQPEFPNGRYKIAARAPHRPKEWIEVELSLRNGEKIYQQSCQLDETGFAILVPEIGLSPGMWDLHSRGDILSELMGDHWEITLSLRVTLNLEQAAVHFPSQSKGKLAKRPDPPEETPETPEEDLSELRSRLLEDADQMLEDIVDDFFPSLTPSLEIEDQSSPNDYTLHLDEEILLTETSKPIILSGEITTQRHPPHPQLCLQISLRDPRTGETVAELSPRLRDQPFPLTFCYSLTVSSPCDSYLLEGEIILSAATPQSENPIFARQPFTVSANWEKLEPILIGAISEAAVSHPPAPLSPLSSSTDQVSQETSARSPGIFPPKLSTARKQKKTTPPTLPNLPDNPPNPSTSTETKEYVWSKPETEMSPLEEWELIPELVILGSDETES
ncbi:hypothetical protein PCC7418_1950 [Halothece sp. PCC 7418]|uniref:hypothetical protein n=1 Tax=Halothece sp. (strain PCC 7418) TaxID=65093 RepID=UPI0002A0789B|nr:hypothetical protein [Halothece sp. PCC 7418]AFZ44118.1 hypothetical protein PCC7418_1950 [Halothece sp. PCC 7418]